MPEKLNVKFSGSYRTAVKFRAVLPFALSIFFTFLISVSEARSLPTCFAREISNLKKEAESDERQILSEIRIAKRFIENRQWEKSRLKLENIIAAFPQNKHLDIVYYWLAYALFQQKKFTEAEQTAGVLRRRFPDSVWFDEARLLLVEINSRNGRQINLSDEEFSQSDDETKGSAVENLLETNRPQAIIKIDEIFAPTGKESNNLKESVLILLFDDKSDWATNKFIEVIETEENENLLKQALIGLKKRSPKKTLPILQEFLRRNADANLIDAALFTVANFPGEDSIRALISFAGDGANEQLRQKSIIWLGNIGSKTAIEELKILYGFYSETDLKKQVQISLGEMGKPESLNTLIDLIEGETNPDLIEHGLEILKHKNERFVLKYLEKRSVTKNPKELL